MIKLRLPITEEQVLQFYTAGKSMPEISKILQISLRAVARRLPRHLRRGYLESGRLRWKRDRIQTDIDKIKSLYLRAELPMSEIAKAMGISASVIIRRIRESGFRRTRSEAAKVAGKRQAGKKRERIVSNGYIMVFNPRHERAGHKGYVMEHFIIWESVHGRLPKGYLIHHLNGIKNDNRPENLAAMPKRQHRTQEQLLVKALRARIRKLESRIKVIEAQGLLL